MRDGFKFRGEDGDEVITTMYVGCLSVVAMLGLLLIYMTTR